MNVVPIFGERDRKESERLKAVHYDHLGLEELAADLGTADDWLGTAIIHAKVAQCAAGNSSTVMVSKAALSLLVWKLEELLHDGEAWRPGMRFD